jgi:hypothetical protein
MFDKFYHILFSPLHFTMTKTLKKPHNSIDSHRSSRQKYQELKEGERSELWWRVTLHVQSCSGRNRIIPLMRRPNTDSAPNMPVKLPRKTRFDRLCGHESRRHCHDTVLRYAVTLQMCTYLNMVQYSVFKPSIRVYIKALLFPYTTLPGWSFCLKHVFLCDVRTKILLKCSLILFPKCLNKTVNYLSWRCE